MDRKLIQTYLEQYKAQFDRISKLEIYKWKAIKQFQTHFDLKANDLYGMFEKALGEAGNLMNSRDYYPKNLLLENIEVSPDAIRVLFRDLYNEEEDYTVRIKDFRAGFKTLNQQNFPGKNDYQDHRAVLVYLALRYPERHYFYKFGMFEKFTKAIGYPYSPKKGRIENISQFHQMCDLVRYEIEQDETLLRLHRSRLGEDCYQDAQHHVLTQDFIYAVAKHLDQVDIDLPSQPPVEVQYPEPISAYSIDLRTPKVNLSGKMINHEQKTKRQKRLGDLGELWVLEQEKQQLIAAEKPKLANKIKHVAFDQGDGLGYDILSFDEKGNKKYIEVKTTTGPKNQPFYITRNELEASRKYGDNYFLYRVYAYDDQQDAGELFILQGDMSAICVEPVSYRVEMMD
jgi:hypothetical protein